MAKYIMLYKGPATPAQDMAPEKRQEIMEAWGRWMESCGEAMVDIGQPMANGFAINDQGAKGAAAELNGFSIIEAKNADDAEKLTQGHPFLSDNTGKFWIELHELQPVPGM